jgi:hypothetical protein
MAGLAALAYEVGISIWDKDVARRQGLTFTAARVQSWKALTGM